MIGWISGLAVLLAVALIYLLWRYFKLDREYSELKGEVEGRAREIFEGWRATELERVREDAAKEVEIRADEKAKVLFQEWKQREEEELRRDAIKRSEAVIRGRITEHLMPFFPDFKYNPKDARFIGNPVDLIVFDGLSEGEVKKIVFVEVKTGRNPSLSERERKVRDCVRNREVSYEVIHRGGEG